MHLIFVLILAARALVRGRLVLEGRRRARRRERVRDQHVVRRVTHLERQTAVGGWELDVSWEVVAEEGLDHLGTEGLKRASAKAERNARTERDARATSER